VPENRCGRRLPAGLRQVKETKVGTIYPIYYTKSTYHPEFRQDPDRKANKTGAKTKWQGMSDRFFNPEDDQPNSLLSSAKPKVIIKKPR
jgi:hypothetical protein